jgi:hypothetical protein
VADILDTTGSRSAALVLAWLRGPRGWQAVLAAGLAVMTAAGATVALHVSDPAAAETRVDVARLAQVYLPDGSNHAAVEGEVLPRGAEVHTGRDGGAQLVTAGRRVYLDGLSTLRVEDGVRETLSNGNAMVDARDGAHLDLTTPAGIVTTPDGGVARVEEGLLTRVASYAGTTTLRPVSRSSTTRVPALYQLKVQPQALPLPVTPLQLAKDSWERAVAANLVSADDELVDLADGLSQAEGATYLVKAASYRAATVPAAGADRGELALTVAVARAAHVPAAESRIRDLRGNLGSWGVVAALVKAPVSDVGAQLSAALSPGTTSSAPTIVNASGPQVVLPGTSPSPAPTRTQTTPTSRPTAVPTAVPSASAGPATGLVNDLVTTVTTLLSPSPVPPLSPARPDPSPTPPCILGAVLC